MTPDTNEMKPFWMVYGIGQGGPTVRHETEDKAQREADRLARANPGVTFVLLEATKAVRRRDLERFDLRAPLSVSGLQTRLRAIDDDIPF